jgi:uncharacterized membrane protein
MVIDWGAFARAIHVLAVVVWIGGVWLVTTVLLPLMREKPAERWLVHFRADCAARKRPSSLFCEHLHVADEDSQPRSALGEFEAIEQRFAPQARTTVVLTLLSGLYMLSHYHLWNRFARVEFWWMHLMVGVWLVFATLLFVLEPIVSRRVFNRRHAESAESSFTLVLWFHRVMLALSLLAIFAAVGGGHGLL